MTTKTIQTCTRCGGEIYPPRPEGEESIHLDTEWCVQTMQLRVAKMEGDAAQQRNYIVGLESELTYESLFRVRDDYLMRRVAELEAALAEQQFRPMTETPPRAGLYEVAEFLGSGVLYEVDHAFWGEGGWEEGESSYIDPSRMTHYRSIPKPLPLAPGEEGIAP